MTENTFNVHSNRTADGVLIIPGLRVWTNEMVQGVVISDDHAPREGVCCGNPEHQNGQVFIRDMRGWFTDHSATCEDGKYCTHNHWFTVETANGTKSFDGERLATKFEGREA